jgi:hypothetical protein
MGFVRKTRFWMMAFGFCLAALPGLALSQENPPPEMTEKQVQEFVQDHFNKMYKRAAKTAAEELKLGGNLKAFAVVADRQQNIRQVNIDGIEKMPANVALEIMRRSLQAMVKKGNVGATVLVYTTANPKQDAEAESVLVAEMQHIFGPAQAQITPYTNSGGKTKFGEPVTADLKPTLFNYKINPETGKRDTK